MLGQCIFLGIQNNNLCVCFPYFEHSTKIEKRLLAHINIHSWLGVNINQEWILMLFCVPSCRWHSTQVYEEPLPTLSPSLPLRVHAGNTSPVTWEAAPYDALFCCSYSSSTVFPSSRLKNIPKGNICKRELNSNVKLGSNWWSMYVNTPVQARKGNGIFTRPDLTEK